MKRDLELVRKLLLEFEKLGLDDAKEARQIVLPPWTSDEVTYNCWIMWQSDLIEGIDCSSNSSGRNMFVRGLRPAGHDYIDAVRSDTVWNKVKARAAEQSLSMSIDIAKALAITVITAMLRIS